MRKIIVTGSAPYLPDWWKENKNKLSGFEVHSINTSILVTKDVCKKWWYSEDFFCCHPKIDLEIVPLSIHCFNMPSLRGVYEFGKPPYLEYNRDKGGTMLFNIIQHLYNENVEDKNIEEVNVIGCDLIYKEGQQNHFYGKGTPDPMRLGLDVIKENVEIFKQAYEKAGIRLYNFSTQGESLLTFEKRIL